MADRVLGDGRDDLAVRRKGLALRSWSGMSRRNRHLKQEFQLRPAANEKVGKILP